MKKILMSCLFLLVLSIGLEGQTPLSGPRLAGIVNLPDAKRAVLEVPPAALSGTTWLVLAEGQREGEVEMLEIHPENATVKLNLHSKGGITNLALSRRTDQQPDTSPGIVLENVSLEPVLSLYGEFSERTLLRSQPLPNVTFTAAGSAPDRGAAAQILQKALAERELVAIPDGEKFIMVVRKAQAATVTPRSAAVTPSVSNSQSEMVPAGAINFPNTDVAPVIQIYAELVGRKLDQSSPIPLRGTIQFRSQTPLTRDEARYALDTVLSWAGVKMVPFDPGFVKPVLVSESRR